MLCHFVGKGVRHFKSDDGVEQAQAGKRAGTKEPKEEACDEPELGRLIKSGWESVAASSSFVSCGVVSASRSMSTMKPATDAANKSSRPMLRNTRSFVRDKCTRVLAVIAPDGVCGMTQVALPQGASYRLLWESIRAIEEGNTLIVLICQMPL